MVSHLEKGVTRNLKSLVPSSNGESPRRRCLVRYTAELPGLERKDVEMSVDDGMLTIKGEKKIEVKDNEKDKNTNSDGAAAARSRSSKHPGHDVQRRAESDHPKAGKRPSRRRSRSRK
jgi:hypothetical protein